jgi:hypothetical protein
VIPSPISPSQTSTSAENARDPVAALRELVSSIPQGKTLHWTAEDIERWRGRHPSSNLYKSSDATDDRYGFTYKVESIDVQKTDSLMTPYLGYILLNETQHSPTEENFQALPKRITLGWQGEKWVGKKVEFEGTNGWEEMSLDLPDIRVVMHLIPVQWDGD